MKRPSVLVSIALLLTTFPLIAQTSYIPFHPFGRIVAADLRPPDLGLIRLRGITPVTAEAAAQEEQTAFSFGTLSAKDTHASNSAGFALGYGTKWIGRDVVFVGSYSRFRPGAGDAQDRAIAAAEMTIAETPFATFAGSLAAVYDPGSFKLYNPVLAAEHTFIEKTLKATLNLGWTRIDPNGGDSISDLQPAIGVTLSPDHHHFWSFAADYTFDNDVDGEDTGSISVTRTVARFGSKIKLSVEKHQVIGLSLTRFF